LVENALRHGLLPTVEGGQLQISARRVLDELRVHVADDGAGMTLTDSSSGVGLANTRARLEALYGQAASLAMTSAIGRGTEVIVTLPFRPAEARNGHE
jgi:LytS/YehU family sensor histidine kinase